MNNKTLGTIALLGAPFLLLDFLLDFRPDATYIYSFHGALFNFLYMAGWMCSIIGLLQTRTEGGGRAGQIVLFLQLACLTVAQVWNVHEMIFPGNKSPF